LTFLLIYKKLVYDKPLSHQSIEEYPEMKDVYYSIHKDMVEENETISCFFMIAFHGVEYPDTPQK